MKKIFVAVPPKYGLDDNEIRDYAAQIEQTAHKAEKLLNEYVEVVDCNVLYSYLIDKDDNNNERTKGFIFSSLYALCKADLAVFAGDWEHFKECRLLHTIAPALDIPVIDLNTFSTKEAGND